MLTTMKNSQLSLEKKFYVKFVKDFSGLFCINITWHHGNLNVKCFFWWYLLKYIQNKWKTYFKVKTVFNQKIEAETVGNYKIIKNHWIPNWFPGPQSTPQNSNFSCFLWFQGVISCRIKPPKIFFLVFLVEVQ